MSRWLGDSWDTPSDWLGYIWDTIKYLGIQVGYMEQVMADRKNLKINEDTHEKLSQAKRDNETWDGFFTRLLDQRNEEMEELLRTVFREELAQFAKEREQE